MTARLVDRGWPAPKGTVQVTITACAATGGDYGGDRLARLILALFYVGARRLEHLRSIAGDPLIARFCGLARIPTAFKRAR